MPENDGKIYITISDTRAGGGGTTSLSELSKNRQADWWKMTQGVLRADQEYYQNAVTVAGAMVGMATQSVNFALSNIGNFSGSYQSQREIDAAKSAILKTTGFLGATVAGGGAGAVAYASVMLFNFGISEFVNEVQFRKQNYDIAKLREISGLNGLTNGGRI